MTALRAFEVRGVIDADAVLLRRDARRRALTLWAPGCRAHAVGDAVVLIFEAPRALRAERAPGAVLWWRRGALVGVEVPDDADLPADAVALPVGGALVVSPIGPPLDVSAWIDTAGWRVVEPVTCLAPPPPPVVVVAPPPADVRAAFGDGVAPPSREAEALRAALADASDPDAPPASGGWAGALRGLLRAARAGGAQAPAALPGPIGAGGGGSAGRAPTGPRRPGLLDRLDGWLTERLAANQLGGVLGRRHARHLRDMMARFEGDDLAEALRHAIPLGGEGGGGPLVGLRLPTPRGDLSIGAGGGAPSVFPIADGLRARIEEVYRRAAEQLTRAERYDEAAFVLAELLGEGEKAVDLLESKRLFARAAEVAEACELPAERAVRLRFLAGDVDGAVALARRTGSFADAVARLEARDREAGEGLRALWAVTEAAAGDYGRAVQVLRPLGLTASVGRWIDAVLADAGPGAPAMLALKLATAPDGFAAVRPLLEAILDDDGPVGPSRRANLAGALTTELRAQPGNRALHAAGRAAARAVLRDQGTAWADVGRAALVTSLAQALGGPLRHDLPELGAAPARVRLSAREAPLELALAAADCGTRAVLDAATLPDGRALLALGEAGAALVDRRGKVLTRWEQPADALVLGPTGQRAILVARAGRATARLARVDLVTRRAAHWQDVELARWAPTFDAAGWHVATADRLYLIDALADTWRALWSLPLEGGLVDLAVDDGGLGMLLAEPGGESFEVWRFERPGPRLRGRTPLNLGAAAAPLAAARVRPDGEPEVWHAVDQRLWRERPMSATLRGALAEVVLGAGWTAIVQLLDGGRAVALLPAGGAAPAATLTFEGAHALAVRLDGVVCTVCDDRGRVVGLSLVDGEVLLDLRI